MLKRIGLGRSKVGRSLLGAFWKKDLSSHAPTQADAGLTRQDAGLIRQIEPKPLRYALLGAGSAARSHLANISRIRGVTVIGIADPADPQTWRVSGEHAAVRRFTDATQLFHELKPDLVSVCTPTKYHRELTLMALRAGAHVVCEKPMAMTVAEAEEMEAVRVSTGKLGAINFSYRNLPAFRVARELIANRKLGCITRVNVVYLQGFLAAPTSRWSWRSDVSLAGFGALGDLGVHMIDSVRFVTNLEFQRVVAAFQTRIPAKQDGAREMRTVTTDTNAAFLAELSGGALAIFETSQVAVGYHDFFQLEVSGEYGTLVANSERPDGVRLHIGASYPPKTNMPFKKILPASFHYRAPTTPGAIVHAIRGAQVAHPTFADGIAAQRVLGALVESIQSGGWVAPR